MGNITPQQFREMEIRLHGKNRAEASIDPVENESQLHYDIIDYCDSKNWQYLHGAMSRRTHRTKGEPDFAILRDGGITLYVECKTKTGKLTPEQLAFAAMARRNGHTVYLVRSMEDFKMITRDGADPNLYAIT